MEVEEEKIEGLLALSLGDEGVGEEVEKLIGFQLWWSSGKTRVMVDFCDGFSSPFLLLNLGEA